MVPNSEGRDLNATSKPTPAYHLPLRTVMYRLLAGQYTFLRADMALFVPAGCLHREFLLMELLIPVLPYAIPSKARYTHLVR